MIRSQGVQAVFDNFPIMVCSVFAVLVLGGFQLLGQYVIDCRVADQSVQLVLFHFFKIQEVPFDRILEVRLFSRKEIWSSLKQIQFSPSITFVGRPFGQLVLIRLKENGLIKNIVISPHRPNEFIAAVQQRLHGSLQHSP